MNSQIPTHEQISARAYQIFVERGCPEGRDLDHWLEAEAQLRGETEQKPGATANLATASATSTQKPAAPRTATARKAAGKSAAQVRM